QHRVDAAHHGPQALVVDGLGQHRGGGGAVAGPVRGLAGDLADHAGAPVLVLVLQVDLLGDGDAVLGHGRRAEGLLEDYLATLGAERDLDGAGELADAAAHGLAGFLVEGDLFGSHSLSSIGVGVSSRGQVSDLPAWVGERAEWKSAPTVTRR